MADSQKIKIDGETYTLKKISGYELTKLTAGLDDADALLKIITACVEELDEEKAKKLDPGPYLKLAVAVQEFLGIRRSDLKKFSEK